jgi:hypothetical protein
MRIDTGTVVIVAAVLLFYLRLILVQRERAKRLRAAEQEMRSARRNSGKKNPGLLQEQYARLSILSTHPRDLAIAGMGVLLVVLGVLFNRQILPWELGQVYWWLSMALGILAFSWAFR